MYRLFIVLVSSFLILFGHAKGQCYFNQADKFDNIWVVNNSEVICLNKQNQKIGTYSNILFGDPLYIDPLDPFRIIVYYPGVQSMVVLNNRVAEISKPIMLHEKGITDASLVCRSGKGGFWVLDRANWEILYFDSGFNLTGEKIMLDLNFSESKPLFMQENKGVLYIAFRDKAICRFDQFGARMGDIPVKVDRYFTIIDNSIIYQTKGDIYQYNINNNQNSLFNLSVKCIPVKSQGQFLYFDGRMILSVDKIR